MLSYFCQRRSLFFFLLVLAAILMASIHADQKNQQFFMDQQRRDAEIRLNILVSTALDAPFRQFETILTNLASDRRFAAFTRNPSEKDEDFVRSLWQNILVTHSSIHYLYFSTADGKLFFEPEAPLPDSYDARRRPWFRHAMLEPGTILWTHPYMEVPTNRRVVSVVRALTDPESGELLGVMGLDILLDHLHAIAGRIPIPEGGFLGILSSDGQLVASPQPEIMEALLKKPASLVALLRGETDTLHLDGQAKELIISTRTLNQPQWRIVQGIPRSPESCPGSPMRSTALILMTLLSVSYLFIHALYYRKQRQENRIFKSQIQTLREQGPSAPHPALPSDTSFTHSLCRQLALDLYQSEQKKQELETELATFIEKAPVGVFISTPEGRFTKVNSSMARILEYASPEELIHHVDDIPQKLYLDRQDRKILTNRLLSGGVQEFPIRFRKKNGTIGHASITAYATMGTDGRILAIQGFFTDMTRSHQLESHLRRLAHTDRLTGLPNRRSFMELLARETGRFCRYGNSFGLIVLNVDHFRAINARYGHGMGDKILCTLADSLSQSLRSCDTLARIDGDTFAIHLAETSAESSTGAAKRVLRLISRTVITEIPDLQLSFSSGTTSPRETLRCPDLLLQEAEARMYEAKKKGGGTLPSSLP
ncbi:diguanylate cyclase [Desulfobotulus sp. H1]|uniref:Diguanylate cyclase n=1 Tax=Desulfobotulus pelophilus TaxID=2823377 RepID=A0ABT3N514_9BACT|nr:diguanylate cyclase [Desulfobotulus pelophilus]MCW7752547.1 diguanylate cyclase [Desulfobotulus pelophilus]